MSRAKPLGLRLSDAGRALAKAKLARDMHAGECMDWDYENPEACLTCADLETSVREARARLRALEEK